MRKTRLIIIFSVLAFTALVVLLGSVIFSVKEVTVLCVNADDTALETKVENFVDMKGSIFFLNERNHTEKIETAFPDVIVNTIERVFPSSVRIEIIKKYKCAYIEIEGSYYVLDDSARVIAVYDSVPDDVIKTEIDKTSISKSKITQKVIGKDFKTDKGIAETMLKELFSAMFRLEDYSVHEITALYKNIVCETEEKELILYTQGATGSSGAKIVIIGLDRIDDKVAKALSLYTADDKYKHGTIRVYTRQDTGDIATTHEP